MTQQTSGNLTPPDPVPELKTSTGKRMRAFLLNIWEPVDLLGQSLVGSLWKTLCLNIQDAIALALALQIPDLLGKLIIGKDFSSFNACWNESALGVSRYACYLIVMSDFALWIVLAGRVLGRSVIDIGDLLKEFIRSIRNRR